MEENTRQELWETAGLQENLGAGNPLCQCGHQEFIHVDEEGHGSCRYCSCDGYVMAGS